jgi:hypothetical protein
LEVSGHKEKFLLRKSRLKIRNKLWFVGGGARYAFANQGRVLCVCERYHQKISSLVSQHFASADPVQTKRARKIKPLGENKTAMPLLVPFDFCFKGKEKKIPKKNRKRPKVDRGIDLGFCVQCSTSSSVSRKCHMVNLAVFPFFFSLPYPLRSNFWLECSTLTTERFPRVLYDAWMKADDGVTTVEKRVSLKLGHLC